MKYLTVVMLMFCAFPALAMDKGPDSVVSNLVKVNTYRSGSTIFSDKPSPTLRRYFSADFVRLWARAHSLQEAGPGDDGDPISGYQMVKSLKIDSISTSFANEEHAVIQTILTAFSAEPGGSDRHTRVRFELVREAGKWKIKDVGNEVYSSLYEYLANEAKRHRRK